MSAEEARALYWLRCRSDQRDRTWLLPAGESTLGSAATNDFVLPVQGVSRQHARLRVDREGVELTDLASTNGSFVNGERIARARILRQALHQSGGSQRKAAARLGISRNTLTRKLRRLGIVE